MVDMLTGHSRTPNLWWEQWLPPEIEILSNSLVSGRDAGTERVRTARLAPGDLLGVPQPRVIDGPRAVRIGFLDLDDDALHHVASLVGVVPRSVGPVLI